MEEKLYIYFTNDLHSNFEQWPKTVKYIKEMRGKREARGETYFVVDIGDHMDRVHPISEALKGKANVELLNEAGYDVVTIGNNEGITLSHDDFYQLYDDAEFAVVCANLNHKGNRPPKWLEETKIIKTKSGIRIGFIGLTAPFNPFYEPLGWHLTSPYDELERQLEPLSKQTDIIILLSHLGLSEDEEIARRFPEIDVIIGGHTHHVLKTGAYVHNSLLAAAGKHCMYAGQVIMTFDLEKRQVIKKEAYATDISDYTPDEETEKLIQFFQEKADKILNEEVVELQEDLNVDWFQGTPIIQDLTDTLREWTNADVSLLNAGMLLDGLPKGTVTYGDVHRICPHPINPVVIHLRGDELIEVIRASCKRDFIDFELIGFGFRGKIIGKMLFSGLSVTTTVHADGTESVTDVTFEDGREVEKQETYRVATADMFTFGRLLPEIAKSEKKEFYLPEFLRDLLLETLKKKYSNQKEQFNH